MAWAFVQDDSLSNAATSTTIAVTLGSSVASGSLIVVFVTAKTTTATATCAGSVNGSYTSAVGPTTNAGLGGGGFTSWIFYFENSGAGSETATVTFSTTLPNRRMVALEYSGIATSGALDVVAAAIGNSASPNSGANTTTAANELIFGGGLTDSGNIGNGAGFTARASGDAYDEAEDKNGASAGSYSTTFTTTSAQWIAQMATFKEPAAGGGLSIPVAMHQYARLRS